MASHRKERNDRLTNMTPICTEVSFDDYSSIEEDRRRNPDAFAPLSWGKLARRGFVTLVAVGAIVIGIESIDSDPPHSSDHSVDR